MLSPELHDPAAVLPHRHGHPWRPPLGLCASHLSYAPGQLLRGTTVTLNESLAMYMDSGTSLIRTPLGQKKVS